MFKLKYLFVILFLSIFGVINVSAKECNYPEIGLKIVDGNLEGLDAALPRIIVDSQTEASQEVSEVLNNGDCASKVYVCKYNSLSLSAGSVIDVISDVSWENLNKILPNATVSIEKNIIMDEASFKNSKYNNVYERNGIVVSTTTLDKMGDAYNYCSGGSDDILAKAFGVFCGGVMMAGHMYGGLAVYAIDDIMGDNRAFYIDLIKCNTSNSDDPNAVDANCSQIHYLKNDYEARINDYKACNGEFSCKSKSSSELNTIETKLRGYCNSIVKNYSFDELQSDCLTNCFNLQKDLNKMKEGTDLYRGIKNGKTCNVSDKLINWVANIIRWVRYLAPVLVIILGILDFIKAIASQSEDEMKKVQKRFVIRLIVAALFFLIPFILEFALKAFNLLSEDPYCGLI